jgi:hypothetical protein
LQNIPGQKPSFPRCFKCPSVHLKQRGKGKNVSQIVMNYYFKSIFLLLFSSLIFSGCKKEQVEKCLDTRKVVEEGKKSELKINLTEILGFLGKEYESKPVRVITYDRKFRLRPNVIDKNWVYKWKINGTVFSDTLLEFEYSPEIAPQSLEVLLTAERWVEENAVLVQEVDTAERQVYFFSDKCAYEKVGTFAGVRMPGSTKMEIFVNYKKEGLGGFNDCILELDNFSSNDSCSLINLDRSRITANLFGFKANWTTECGAPEGYGEFFDSDSVEINYFEIFGGLFVADTIYFQFKGKKVM